MSLSSVHMTEHTPVCRLWPHRLVPLVVYLQSYRGNVLQRAVLLLLVVRSRQSGSGVMEWLLLVPVEVGRLGVVHMFAPFGAGECASMYGESAPMWPSRGVCPLLRLTLAAAQGCQIGTLGLAAAVWHTHVNHCWAVIGQQDIAVDLVTVELLTGILRRGNSRHLDDVDVGNKSVVMTQGQLRVSQLQLPHVVNGHRGIIGLL